MYSRYILYYKTLVTMNKKNISELFIDVGTM